jgi:hypothetical protein
MIRRLARENRAMGLRLAQLEYREMRAELANPDLFEMAIDFPGAGGPPPPRLRAGADDPLGRRLASLNVPLGRIAWASDPDALPVVGLHVPGGDHGVLRKAFADLMKRHHAAPFARLVFCCEEFRPVPFLGRYGFALELVMGQRPGDYAPRLSRRFGLTEVRDLCTGAVLWQSCADQAPDGPVGLTCGVNG